MASYLVNRVDDAVDNNGIISDDSRAANSDDVILYRNCNVGSSQRPVDTTILEQRCVARKVDNYVFFAKLGKPVIGRVANSPGNQVAGRVASLVPGSVVWG